MTTRSVVVACIVQLIFAAGAGAGQYQRTNDGRAYVWNNFPKPDDSVSWSGGIDSQRYATGNGTLTWYQSGTWVSRYSGTMVHGKLNGFVTNEDADGTKFQGTYVSGRKSSDWSEVTAARTSQSTALSPPEPIELVRAASAGYVDYTFSGMDNSGAMQVRIVNKTEREWMVSIEVGTKLEPASGNAQSMVVTKELEIHLHPHDSQTVEVEVNCLDISKPPPMTTDRNWSAQVSARLAAFIACVNRTITAAADQAPSDQAEILRKAQPFLLQVALWQARGATKDQWIDFFVHYQGMTQDRAQAQADFFEQLGGAIVRECPSI